MSIDQHVYYTLSRKRNCIYGWSTWYSLDAVSCPCTSQTLSVSTNKLIMKWQSLTLKKSFIIWEYQLVLKPTQVSWYKCTKGFEWSLIKELGKITPWLRRRGCFLCPHNWGAQKISENWFWRLFTKNTGQSKEIVSTYFDWHLSSSTKWKALKEL